MTKEDVVDYFTTSNKPLLIEQDLLIKMFKRRPLTDDELFWFSFFFPESKPNMNVSLTESIAQAKDFFCKNNLNMVVVYYSNMGIQLLINKNERI